MTDIFEFYACGGMLMVRVVLSIATIVAIRATIVIACLLTTMTVVDGGCDFVQE